MGQLTTQDVHMKSFTATKFREGYDPDEVDDFLDEVILTLGQLYTENSELKAQLEEAQNSVAATGDGAVKAVSDSASEQRIAQLEEQLSAANNRVQELESQVQQHGAREAEGAANNGEAEALRGELAQANARIAELEKAAETAATESEHNAVATDQHESAATDPQSASSMLALAQRVHDEYVRDGQQEGARIIEEAKAQGRQMLRESEQKRDEVLQGMEQHRDELQGRIEELKHFESDYRQNLRSHLEDLLSRVNTDAR